jgi:putative membrane protein insertion efficiency factor
MTALFQRVLLALLLVYRRVVSPGLGNHCRYHPSCAAYAQGALERFGAVRGSALALWRLLRCNPLSRGGYDPVPELERSAQPLTLHERHR